MLTLGLCIFFATEFIKALPWPQKWAQRKPLGCRVCLTGWTVIGIVLWGESPLLVSAAGGCALLLGSLNDYWRGLSVGPPPG